MKIFFQKFSNVIYASLLALICLFLCIKFYQDYSQHVLLPDELQYKNLGVSLISDIVNSKIDRFVQVTPGYPALIAIIYKLFGFNDNYVYFFQILLSLLSVVFIYFTINLVIDNRFISFLFSFFFLMNYSLWTFIAYLLMEIPTVFFLIISIYFLVRFMKSNKVVYLIIFSFLFTCLIFLNNRFMFHATIIYSFLLIRYLKNKIKLLLFSGSALLILLLLNPWFVRQYHIYHRLVLFTPLWHNVANKSIGFPSKININTDDVGGEKIIQLKSYIEYKSEIEVQKGRQASTNFTLDNYKHIVGVYNSENKIMIYMYRLRNFFIPFYLNYSIMGPNDARLIYPSKKIVILNSVLNLIPILLLALCGFIYAVKKKNTILIILGLFYISHIILHVMVHFVDRYRLPILPVVYILASYTIFEFITYLSKYPRFSLLKQYVLTKATISQ